METLAPQVAPDQERWVDVSRLERTVPAEFITHGLYDPDLEVSELEASEITRRAAAALKKQGVELPAWLGDFPTVAITEGFRELTREPVPAYSRIESLSAPRACLGAFYRMMARHAERFGYTPAPVRAARLLAFVPSDKLPEEMAEQLGLPSPPYNPVSWKGYYMGVVMRRLKAYVQKYDLTLAPRDPDKWAVVRRGEHVVSGHVLSFWALDRTARLWARDTAHLVYLPLLFSTAAQSRVRYFGVEVTAPDYRIVRYRYLTGKRGEGERQILARVLGFDGDWSDGGSLLLVDLPSFAEFAARVRLIEPDVSREELERRYAAAERASVLERQFRAGGIHDFFLAKGTYIPISRQRVVAELRRAERQWLHDDRLCSQIARLRRDLSAPGDTLLLTCDQVKVQHPRQPLRKGTCLLIGTYLSGKWEDTGIYPVEIHDPKIGFGTIKNKSRHA
ncbi:MAG: hypothetical protein D6806_09815 [Deltaproteobacteria bacterium]|nr:MAG: hypothetical protein D6806_09815 [Deltaproteobacteria bacterium]